MHGVVNFLKPPGMTSHDAVAWLRRVLGTKRIGHTGTLDPAAAGVLPLCVGHATRLVEYLQASRKVYVAEATFGYETDTLDAVGNVVHEADASHVTLESVRQALDPFRGDIMQTPPMFSAIKKGGQKLYDLARAGATEEELGIEPRPVQIYGLRVVRFIPSEPRPRAILYIECGSGTYIRSLIRDIGRALGCGATMTFLVRNQTGLFDIASAHTVDVVEQLGLASLVPISQVLETCVHTVIQDDLAISRLVQGQVVESISPEKAWLKRYISEGNEEKVRRTAASRVGTGLVLFTDSGRKSAVLVKQLTNEPATYKPEKVFLEL